MIKPRKKEVIVVILFLYKDGPNLANGGWLCNGSSTLLECEGLSAASYRIGIRNCLELGWG